MAVKFCVTVVNPLAEIVVVNAPCMVAVVVVSGTPPQLIEPPKAICAKLGCPPAAELAKPVQMMLDGLAG